MGQCKLCGSAWAGPADHRCIQGELVDVTAELRQAYAALDIVRADLERVTKERDAALARVEQQTDWYQQRYNRQRRWVEEEVRPLSVEVAHRYYAIVANGSPAAHESADWTDTMHGMRLRLEAAERQRDAALERERRWQRIARIVAERPWSKECADALRQAKAGKLDEVKI